MNKSDLAEKAPELSSGNDVSMSEAVEVPATTISTTVQNETSFETEKSLELIPKEDNALIHSISSIVSNESQNENMDVVDSSA